MHSHLHGIGVHSVDLCTETVYVGNSAMFAAPSWMVDKDDLRNTLDQLHLALQRPVSIVAGAVEHDRSQIASSLRTILARFDAMDLSVTSAISGFVREIRPAVQFEQL